MYTLPIRVRPVVGLGHESQWICDGAVAHRGYWAGAGKDLKTVLELYTPAAGVALVKVGRSAAVLGRGADGWSLGIGRCASCV